MKMKALGSTGLMVSEIGFGCWAIGGDSYGPVDDDVSMSAIDEALHLGCNLFDTADSYGLGRSETVLGKALRRAGKFNDVVISTKGGLYPQDDSGRLDYSVSGIVRCAEASLRRLGRDVIDIYHVHNPTMDVLRTGAIFEALSNLKDRGLIRHCGISVQTVSEGRAAIDWPHLSVLQMPYNILSLLNQEMSLEELGPKIRKRNLGVLANNPLAAGFLGGRHTQDTEYAEGDHRGHIAPALRSLRIAFADGLRPLERPGATLAQISLRYVLDQPLIASALVGIKTAQQAKENFAAANLPCFDELGADFGT